MTVRPIIFISAVSKELRSARQLVANTLQLLGYEPDWQDIFGTEEGDLRGMLRRKVDASAGVVQLVGQCYGAEPRTPDAQFGRVSYTQYEALYGKERGKRVWYMILDEDFTADPHEAEPEEQRALQVAYRERIREGDQLYHPLGNSEELENKVLKLRDDLAALRRRGKQWAAGVVALLILIAGLVSWVIKHEVKLGREQVAMNAKMDKILAQGVAQYASTETKVRQAQPGQKPQEIEERTYEDLSKTLGIDAKTLREKLPQFAKQLKDAPTASTYERASAAYVAKDYNEAERLALVAADEAQKASPSKTADAIKAFELAGQSADARIEYARALEHYRAAAQLTDRVRDPLEWAGQQWDIAFVLDEQGKYADAEAVYRTALSEYERGRGAEDPSVLSVRNNLANALVEQGKYAEAESEYRAVLKLQEKVLGPEHPDTLGSRNNLANALFGQGKYAKAESEYRAVLKLQEKVLGPEHPDTLKSRNNLANALDEQGKYAKAESEYRAVIKLREKVLGPEHPDTLGSRNNLANALDEQGKYAEAESECRAVIKLKEKVLGPEHPDTLKSRNNLANALDDQGKYAEAENEYRAVLKLQEKVLGPEHPDRLMSRNNLASTLDDQGKYAEAESEYRAVLKLQEKVLGPEHPDTLTSRDNLAKTLAGQSKYAKAESEYRAVIKLREKVLGPEHPDTLTSRDNLAKTLAGQSKYAKAESEYRAVIKLREKVLGPEHPDTLKSHNYLAATLAGQSKYAEAQNEYRAVIKLREKVLGPEHPDTLKSRDYLANTLDDQGKYAEAESEYRAVLKLREKVLGPEHPDTLTSRNELAWLLATSTNNKTRNGAEAVELATKDCELSKWSDTEWVDTLAAAEAEAGLFDAAAKHEHQAIDLAKAANGNTKDFEQRLKLYQQHKPYREIRQGR